MNRIKNTYKARTYLQQHIAHFLNITLIEFHLMLFIKYLAQEHSVKVSCYSETPKLRQLQNKFITEVCSHMVSNFAITMYFSTLAILHTRSKSLLSANSFFYARCCFCSCRRRCRGRRTIKTKCSVKCNMESKCSYLCTNE